MCDNFWCIFSNVFELIIEGLLLLFLPELTLSQSLKIKKIKFTFNSFLTVST